MKVEQTGMMNGLFAAGFVGLLAITLAATAAAAEGPDWGEGDAGSLPGDAEIPQGKGALNFLHGGLGAQNLLGDIDFEDMYLINIVDPKNFRVTTDPDDPEIRDAFANFDTQLWLFRPSPANPLQALGFLGNDDHPDVPGSDLSLLIPVPTDRSPPLVEPGLYFLAISRFNIKEGPSNRNDPVSNGGEIFFQEEPQEISGPDGPGGNNKIIGWTGDKGGEFEGEYGIRLRGVEYPRSPIPENDNCADAIPLEVPSMTDGTTNDATDDDAFPDCGTSINTPGVWYSVIGTGNTMTASTCTESTDYDTKISVYCNSCVDPICVAGADDNCDDPFFHQETVEWCSQVGAEYLILVHGFGGQTGDFELDLFDDGVPCVGPVDCTANCPWDLDGNNNVGVGDLLILLANWGNPYGVSDLLRLLANWGPCP